MEENKTKNEKKTFYEQWWFWLIVIIFIIICLFALNSDEETDKISNNNFDTNTMSYLEQLKQNYNEDVKLKENPYKVTNQYDGIYKFSLESDNGNGVIFTSTGVITFNDGNCKIKYETGSDTVSKKTRELEGFYGLNQKDNSTFYFSLNDDGNYELKTYKCEPNEKNLSCELKSAYDLSGCTNNKLELIYFDNQDLNEFDTIFSQVLKEEEEKKIAEEKAKKEQEKTEFIASCQTYTFEQMARNPENFKGTNVKVTGEVVQALYGTSGVDLRVNITKEGTYTTYYTDTIYVVYYPEAGEDKILEGDVITIYGTSQGDYTYTSTLGASINLPLVYGKYIELN